MVFRSNIGELTTAQVQGQAPIVVIPVGSTEQHGPHLPLDTDTRIATAVSIAVTEELNHRSGGRQWYVVAPAIAYGASGEHASFAGTISIGTAALHTMIVEYGRSACQWARRLVFINGHGGNVEALRSAVSLLRYEGREVGWCPCVAENADAHAGHTETSVLLHIAPEDVQTQHWRCGNCEPLVTLMPRIRQGGVVAVSAAGVLGDPTTATSASGAQIFTSMTADCVHRVQRFCIGDDGMLV